MQEKRLEGVSVAIDGTSFIDCTLIDCVLEYSGGPVIFQRTYMQGCRYVFFGQARATIHFLQGVGLMQHQPSDWAVLPNVVH